MQEFIDGGRLETLLTYGYRNLNKNLTTINNLNVFPVPDGDTGTNMVHTFAGGLKSAVSSDCVGEYMSSLAKGVLLSARGNSGVIFSQFISGLARALKDKKIICFADMAFAFTSAKKEAYDSILTPVEGTILTIISDAESFLLSNGSHYDDFKSGMTALVDVCKASLAKTPDLLPVLKEAGVVDSGGAGLICFFEGILACLEGVEIEDAVLDIDLAGTQSAINTSNFGPDSIMLYGYCTEFILQLMNAKTDISSFKKDDFVAELEKMGDSIVAVANDGIVKIHIHTHTPEKVLEYAHKFGEFVTLKIENMSVQHSEIATEPEREKYKYAIVTTASGEGIVDYFYGIGATRVIDGGQTNNPSVEAFLSAFDSFDAEHIIVLPNNSNIIFTANQAASMYTKSNVHVIPTKSIVEGYSALSMMNLWSDSVDELIADMSSGLSSVSSAFVTTATRDTTMCGVEIEKGKYIGIEDKEILVCDQNRLETALSLIDKICQKVSREVIIVFYGENVPMSEAEKLKSELEERYPLADIGCIDGKQSVYDYIISLE